MLEKGGTAWENGMYFVPKRKKQPTLFPLRKHKFGCLQYIFLLILKLTLYYKVNKIVAFVM